MTTEDLDEAIKALILSGELKHGAKPAKPFQMPIVEHQPAPPSTVVVSAEIEELRERVRQLEEEAVLVDAEKRSAASNSVAPHCVLCGGVMPIPHNARPLAHGDCCTKCNDNVVAARKAELEPEKSLIEVLRQMRPLPENLEAVLVIEKQHPLVRKGELEQAEAELKRLGIEFVAVRVNREVQ